MIPCNSFRYKLIFFLLLLLIVLTTPLHSQLIDHNSLANTWIRTGGPIGGLGYDVRMHPTNTDTMFVTDAFAGVFKSTNGGRSWTPANNGIVSRGGFSGDAIPIFCLTIDQNKPNIIWAGFQGVRGIFKSTNMGESWIEMDNGVVEFEGITFRGISVDPTSSDIVYAAGEISSFVWAGGEQLGREFDKTKGVVYKTTDGGQNWTAIWRGDNLARYIWIDPGNPDVIYVSTGIFDREAANSEDSTNTPGGVGIIKSVDGGKTWQQKNSGISNLYIGTLFMHPSNPDILLAGSANNAYLKGAGVFLTKNGGETWDKVLNDGVQSVEFAVSNPNIAYAGNPEAVYQSTDGGQNWHKVSTAERGWGPPGIEAGFPIDFQIDPNNPNRLFANNYGGGNFLSEDGGKTWTVASTGYTGAQVRDIAVAPDDPWRVYAAARSGIFASSDGGENWIGLNYPPAGGLEWNAVAIDPANPLHILASNNWIGKILESYDGAETWRDTEMFLAEGKAWRTFAFAPSDTNVIYAGTAAFYTGGGFDGNLPANGIYKSTDRGQSWKPCNDNTSQNAHIADLVVNPQISQLIYAATTNKGILKTTDGGVNWSALNNGLPQQAAVLSVALNPGNPNELYAGLEFAGLYKSVDAGMNWLVVPAGLPAEATVTSIVFNPADFSVIFISDIHSGVYRSTNGGGTWRKINDGLRTRSVNRLAISANGQFLYAATEGEGVFRLNDASGPVSVEVSGQLAKSFHLEQNYPNPFNSLTLITYQVPQNSFVELQIMNINGQIIRTLIDEHQSAGGYSVSWNGKNKIGNELPSAIYFYRIKTGEFALTKKMLLIR